MSGRIRTGLEEMAQHAPSLPLPSGIYDRARRRQRRKRVLASTGMLAVLLMVVAAGAGLVRWTPRPVVDPAEIVAVDDMPVSVSDPPHWIASVEDAPLPRALVAFTKLARGDVILVGPDDRYRYYAGGEGRPLLSPDGRYLLTGRGLLDVTTGSTRWLEGDVPLGFSPDSRLALLARYEPGDEVRGWILAVDVGSGKPRWSLALEPGLLPRDLRVALSPDGSTIMLQRHGDLMLYGVDGREVWRRDHTGYNLAGQNAIVLERRSVAVASTERVCLYDLDGGASGLCLPDMSKLIREKDGPAEIEVLGWEAGFPIVSLNGDVISLNGVPRTVLRGPEQVSSIGFASVRVRWSGREPGPPDTGPFFDRRYRPVPPAGVVVLALMLVGFLIAVGVRLRRRRR